MRTKGFGRPQMTDEASCGPRMAGGAPARAINLSRAQGSSSNAKSRHNTPDTKTAMAISSASPRAKSNRSRLRLLRGWCLRRQRARHPDRVQPGKASSTGSYRRLGEGRFTGCKWNWRPAPFARAAARVTLCLFIARKRNCGCRQKARWSAPIISRTSGRASE